MPSLNSKREIERIAAAALAEDGRVDITSTLTVPPRVQAAGVIEHRSGGILSGTRYADEVAKLGGCKVEWSAQEGDLIGSGFAVGVIRGPLADILRVERPLLNLLQRASGIATATRVYVDAIQGTRCRILHTRKTAPGLRSLDLAAVLAGGGHPHRSDLSHEVLVKDNHWQALGRSGKRLGEALAEGRKRGIKALYVEVETLEQLELACAAGATRLLVDNQPPATVRKWAQLARERAAGIEIEASGGITLENVREYAEAGADFISVGALTHSARAADIAIEVKI
ncbi:MAG TPA: carboxylating nicotinate-nucleotide diphosphorylase [Gemmatimonadales bacterium]|nr:carboxylating nicotinate-nucleotide diphosphorylase [Gemmatimonadales bacterium]